MFAHRGPCSTTPFRFRREVRCQGTRQSLLRLPTGETGSPESAPVPLQLGTKLYTLKSEPPCGNRNCLDLRQFSATITALFSCDLASSPRVEPIMASKPRPGTTVHECFSLTCGCGRRR